MKIRQGNTFTVKWKVNINNEPISEDLNLAVEVLNPIGQKFYPQFSVEDGMINVVIGRKLQQWTGNYTLSVYLNKDEDDQSVVDVIDAFEIVDKNARNYDIVEVVEVKESNLYFNQTGLSAYQLAVERGFEGTIDEWLESLKKPAQDAADHVQDILDQADAALESINESKEEFNDLIESSRETIEKFENAVDTLDEIKETADDMSALAESLQGSIEKVDSFIETADNLATKDDLNDYLLKTDTPVLPDNLATQEWVEQQKYLTSYIDTKYDDTDVKNRISVLEQINHGQFATKDELPDMSLYPLKTEIPDYTPYDDTEVKSDIESINEKLNPIVEYIPQVPSYSDLDNYYDKEYIDNTLLPAIGESIAEEYYNKGEVDELIQGAGTGEGGSGFELPSGITIYPNRNDSPGIQIEDIETGAGTRIDKEGLLTMNSDFSRYIYVSPENIGIQKDGTYTEINGEWFNRVDAFMENGGSGSGSDMTLPEGLYFTEDVFGFGMPGLVATQGDEESSDGKYAFTPMGILVSDYNMDKAYVLTSEGIGNVNAGNMVSYDDLMNSVNSLSPKTANLILKGNIEVDNHYLMYGFNSDNSAQLPFLLDLNGGEDGFDIQFKFQFWEMDDNQQNIFDSEYGLAFGIRNRQFILAVGNSTGTGWQQEYTLPYFAQTDSDYTIRIKGDGGFMTIWINDIVQNINATYQYLMPKTIYVGASTLNSNFFRGAIYLNECYVKKSNTYVWTGTDNLGLEYRLTTDLANITEEGKQVIKDLIDEKIGAIDTILDKIING